MAYPAANWYMNGSGCSDILTEAIGRGPVAVDWVNSGGGGEYTQKRRPRGCCRRGPTDFRSVSCRTRDCQLDGREKMRLFVCRREGTIAMRKKGPVKRIKK